MQCCWCLSLNLNFFQVGRWHGIQIKTPIASVINSHPHTNLSFQSRFILTNNTEIKTKHSGAVFMKMLELVAHSFRYEVNVSRCVLFGNSCCITRCSWQIFICVHKFVWKQILRKFIIITRTGCCVLKWTTYIQIVPLPCAQIIILRKLIK